MVRTRRTALVSQMAISGLVGVRALAWASAPSGGAQVTGRVIFHPGVSQNTPAPAWDLAQAVVYLFPRGGAAAPPAVPPAPAVIRQKNASFEPSFLVISKGQTVQFLNDDSMDHNVFSFSKPKKFD